MSDSCSRNGCNADATFWVGITVQEEFYNLPLCREHMDSIADVHATGELV